MLLIACKFNNFANYFKQKLYFPKDELVHIGKVSKYLLT